MCFPFSYCVRFGNVALKSNSSSSFVSLGVLFHRVIICLSESTTVRALHSFSYSFFRKVEKIPFLASSVNLDQHLHIPFLRIRRDFPKLFSYLFNKFFRIYSASITFGFCWFSDSNFKIYCTTTEALTSKYSANSLNTIICSESENLFHFSNDS